MKSLAHPEWPYAGSPHEWRGFVKDEGKRVDLYVSDQVFDGIRPLSKERAERLKAVYQKQNFGPELK